MFRKIIIVAVMMAATLSVAYAQTGTWSGKLAVQGTSLMLVFHLDDENPTIDSPDQGAIGISAQIERPGAGKVIVRIPSLGARYEGQWLIRQVVGTFT